jgi:hypothetical protein
VLQQSTDETKYGEKLENTTLPHAHFGGFSNRRRTNYRQRTSAYPMAWDLCKESRTLLCRHRREKALNGK